MGTVIKGAAYALFLAACVYIGGMAGLQYQRLEDAWAAEKYETRYIEYCAQPGDTLWDIAGKYAPLDQRTKSFNEFVNWVYEDNPRGKLQVGQKVRVRYHVEKK